MKYEVHCSFYNEMIILKKIYMYNPFYIINNSFTRHEFVYMGMSRTLSVKANEAV